jgi:hypothetical protein
MQGFVFHTLQKRKAACVCGNPAFADLIAWLAFFRVFSPRFRCVFLFHMHGNFSSYSHAHPLSSLCNHTPLSLKKPKEN